MKDINIFEVASRKKFRFNTTKGNLYVEDLWDLPLKKKSGVSLNEIAKSINKRIKESKEEDFVDTPQESTDDVVKLEILKYIIDYRKSEIDAEKKRIQTQQKNDLIRRAIAKKEEEQFEETPIEELKKMLGE